MDERWSELSERHWEKAEFGKYAGQAELEMGSGVPKQKFH